MNTSEINRQCRVTLYLLLGRGGVPQGVEKGGEGGGSKSKCTTSEVGRLSPPNPTITLPNASPLKTRSNNAIAANGAASLAPSLTGLTRLEMLRLEFVSIPGVDPGGEGVKGG